MIFQTSASNPRTATDSVLSKPMVRRRALNATGAAYPQLVNSDPVDAPASGKFIPSSLPISSGSGTVDSVRVAVMGVASLTQGLPVAVSANLGTVPEPPTPPPAARSTGTTLLSSYTALDAEYTRLRTQVALFEPTFRRLHRDYCCRDDGIALDSDGE